MKISQESIEKLLRAYNDMSLVFLGGHKRNELDGIRAFAWRDIPKNTVLFEGVNIGNVDIDKNVELHEDIIRDHIHNPGALHFLKNRIVPSYDDDDKLVYDVPRGGPNCMTPSFYINHAHNKKDSKSRANVMVSNSVHDYQGYNAFVAKKKIKEGAELVLEYDEEVERMMAISKSFLDGLANDENKLANAKARGTSTLQSPTREVVDNLNELCIILRPSNIHGVGIFVGPGGAEVIKDRLEKDSSGIDPFELAKGATPHGTVDLTFECVRSGVTNQRSLLFIEKHLIEFSNMDWDEDDDEGELLIPLPIDGPSSIDLSFLVNSTENTEKEPNLVMKEDADTDTVRGMSSMVITNMLDGGTELVFNYPLIDDKENDGEIESSEESSDYNQDSESTSDTESDASVARGKSVKKKPKVTAVTTGTGTKKKRNKKKNKKKKDDDIDEDNVEDEDEVDEKTQLQNWARGGRKSCVYRSALLGTGKFQHARPPPKTDTARVQLTMPTQSSVVPISELPDHWKKLGRNKWELMWQNKGKPPLSVFSGKNNDEKKMKRTIYCAEKNVACNCPNVEEGQFSIQSVNDWSVKCNNCTNHVICNKVKGTVNSGQCKKLEGHAKNCKTFMSDFDFLYAETNNTCDCGYNLTDLQEKYGCDMGKVKSHLRSCAKWPAMMDRLREYRETYTDHDKINKQIDKQLYDWVRSMKSSDHEKYIEEIEELGF